MNFYILVLILWYEVYRDIFLKVLLLSDYEFLSYCLSCILLDLFLI